ncbi:hypothetical protein FRC01_012268, partial [Tulasnella sp. 417]
MASQFSFPSSVLDATSTINTPVALAIGALVALILHSKYQARKNLPHPPGPRPLPFFG